MGISVECWLEESLTCTLRDSERDRLWDNHLPGNKIDESTALGPSSSCFTVSNDGLFERGGVRVVGNCIGEDVLYVSPREVEPFSNATEGAGTVRDLRSDDHSGPFVATKLSCATYSQGSEAMLSAESIERGLTRGG